METNLAIDIALFGVSRKSSYDGLTGRAAGFAGGALVLDTKGGTGSLL